MGKIGEKLYDYTGLQLDTDQSNNELQSRYGQAMGVFQKNDQKLSWLTTELLEIPEGTMMKWVETTPALEQYRFPLSEMYRQQKHVIDAKGEKLLAYYGPIHSKTSNLFDSVANADATPQKITLSDGSSYTVTASSYRKALITLHNAEDRRLVNKTFYESISRLKNTYASIYDVVCKADWAEAQARSYKSVLSSKLEEDNIPEEIVKNLVNTAKNAKNIVERYHHLRQRILGLKTYSWSDSLIPLIKDDTVYSFDSVAPKAIESVAPLGKDYQKKYAQLFGHRRIDVYESVGKRTGAYSSGTYGVGTFVLLNHQDTLDSAFTIAHELGHSMHSVLSFENQPYAMSHYKIFVAEVASTFNEQLFNELLLKNAISRNEKRALLDHKIQDVIGLFINQSMYTQYELEAHALVEKGETLTADKLTKIWAKAVKDFYGDVISQDDPYMYSWGRVPHFYYFPYYVFKYATSYSASSTLYRALKATKTEEAHDQFVDRYLTLLKSGGNDFPIRQLQKAGVDLTTPIPTESVVNELKQLVDELESYYPDYADPKKL